MLCVGWLVGGSFACLVVVFVCCVASVCVGRLVGCLFDWWLRVRVLGVRSVGRLVVDVYVALPMVLLHGRLVDRTFVCLVGVFICGVECCLVGVCVLDCRGHSFCCLSVGWLVGVGVFDRVCVCCVVCSWVCWLLVCVLDSRVVVLLCGCRLVC